MTLGTETIGLLRQNLDALTFILSPAQHGRTTEGERKTALHTVQVTAEAGAKLAEAVHVNAVTSGGLGTGVSTRAAVAETMETEVEPVRLVPAKTEVEPISVVSAKTARVWPQYIPPSQRTSTSTIGVDRGPR
ncbi:uncharacterized protein H6S33_007138 [Morchella sextelata]|uniref:uncharacterized protein n=1 Tax=Morchella sextelata TaxID=1174677 RepID=UPI001D0543B2|nr:uncharacterized protein H6S33_007138 [Morchella sextelata]KAH0604107.1 hypothetical protein H6S33_007138 [Morchella sextelata]